LIVQNEDETADFVLGDPFFRNSTILLDFANKQISLYYKYVDTPIIPDVWPVAENYVFNQ